MADISAIAAGTVTLGDITVNRLGLGTNRVTDTPETRTLLERAVALGVDFIDTAYRYTGRGK
jgi:pyridoxine 4-dehydrogenase